MNNWEFQHDNSFKQPEQEITVPKRIKLDLKTPLEQFWLGMMIISGLALIISLVHYLDNGVIPQIIPMIGLVGLAIGALCYSNTDNYYILDAEKKCLMYRFKFFASESMTIFAHFSQIHAVTVKGVRKSSKHSTWWEYQTVIVLSSGKIIPVSDMEQEAFNKQSKKAEKFAVITGARLVENLPQHTIKAVRMPDGKYTFTTHPYSIFDSAGAVISIILAIIGVMIFIAAVSAK